MHSQGNPPQQPASLAAPCRPASTRRPDRARQPGVAIDDGRTLELARTLPEFHDPCGGAQGSDLRGSDPFSCARIARSFIPSSLRARASAAQANYLRAIDLEPREFLRHDDHSLALPRSASRSPSAGFAFLPPRTLLPPRFSSRLSSAIPCWSTKPAGHYLRLSLKTLAAPSALGARPSTWPSSSTGPDRWRVIASPPRRKPRMSRWTGLRPTISSRSSPTITRSTCCSPRGASASFARGDGTAIDSWPLTARRRSTTAPRKAAIRSRSSCPITR